MHDPNCPFTVISARTLALRDAAERRDRETAHAALDDLLDALACIPRPVSLAPETRR